MEAARARAAVRQDAGHHRPRRHRHRSGAQGVGAGHARRRRQAHAYQGAARRGRAPAGRDRSGARVLGFRRAVAAGHARHREHHRCLCAAPHEEKCLALQFRARRTGGRRRPRRRSGKRDHRRGRPHVFRQEPLPSDHPFWRAKNIVVLPHVGGVHPDRDRFVAALFVENARRFAQGQPLQALVDRARGY
jgi:hypothetical protein